MNEIDELLEIMRMLRDPEKGCPWDRAQTLESILPFTLEEIHELADSVKHKSMGDVCEELGDLLFHLVFYAQLAAESGDFNFQEVTAGIITKLRRRHPHVFADMVISTVEEQRKSWEEIKSKERSAKCIFPREEIRGLLGGISETLPEILRSLKIQRRAASAGFDWDEAGQVCNKIEEELNELHREINSDTDRDRIVEEFGDLLFSCINLSRHLEIDPELALRKTNRKFINRFNYIEKILKEQKRSINESTIGELEVLWQEAKNFYQENPE